MNSYLATVTLSATLSFTAACGAESSGSRDGSKINYNFDLGTEGWVLKYPPNSQYTSEAQTMATWAAKNGCTGTLTANGRTLDLDASLPGAETTESTYDGCPDGIDVELWTIHGGQHVPDLAHPAWAESIYAFFKAHPKPGDVPSLSGTTAGGSMVAARPYNFKVPTGYDINTPTPLVITLHAAGRSGALQEQYFQLSAIVDEQTFLYAYPDATLANNRLWMTDDAAYVNAIIDDVSSKYNVDTKRIFLVGHSAGAFFAQGLACGVSDRIAAIASLAGALITGGPCNPSSRLSVLDVHGDADTIISYEGGGLGAPAQTLTYTSADGDPNRGALVLTVAFTDIGQFAIAGVDFAQPGLNLSGRTLHARVRLVSGSFDGVLLLGALSGPSFIVAESPAFDAAPLATGAWASLTFDLSTSTVVGFDPSKVVAIGVRALASAPLVRTGETIFEIDTVSD